MISFFRKRFAFWFVVLPAFLSVAAPGARAQSNEDELVRATIALQSAVSRAQADPWHPSYHFTSPAQWMNDPNGPIFHKGYYHLFYQLQPFSDGDGPKYWGHARSRDLAEWERLPIALCPSYKMGENGIWSGCCTLNGKGEPTIFYTSVGPNKSPRDHAEQWAAIGDDDLITWTKVPENPVITDALHGDRKVYEWRDPFIFKEGGRTFLVAGGNLNDSKGGQAVVNIYEARNPELTKWKYRGILFHHPDADARSVECPNFFKLGNRWVLFVSPYNRPQYFVGDFDTNTCEFVSRTRGTLDGDGHFYAPNTLQAPDGRRIVWGWVNGFPGGRGWNGSLTLPRLLSLSPDGELLQAPAPQLKKLRGKGQSWRNVALGGDAKTFTLPETNALEIQTELKMQEGDEVKLTLSSAGNNANPITMVLKGSSFKLMDTSVPLRGTGTKKSADVHIFVDHSILEVFVNNEACVTRLIPPLEGNETLQLAATGPGANASLIETWPMRGIWK